MTNNGRTPIAKSLLPAHRQFTFLLCVGILFSGISRSAAMQVTDQIALPKRVLFSEVQTLLASIGRNVPTVQRKLKIVKENDVVVFVPGMLGSKLIDSETREVLWGQGKPSLKALSLIANTKPVQTEILEDYKLDVYGEMMRELSVILDSDTSVLWFPYDWRQDIFQTAQQLDSRIRNEWREALHGRRLTIIAHSMGGLVAWAWKNNHYRKRNDDFTLFRLITLGTPLEGSCEMLRTLLLGYLPIPDTNEIEKLYYKRMFSELKAAAYTFPSVYQLLPKDHSDDRRVNCLNVNLPQSGPTAVDHFSLRVWENELLPFLEPGSWDRVFRGKKSVWEDLGFRKTQFVQHLGNMLATGKKFWLSLKLSEDPLAGTTTREGAVRYFYSKDHLTTHQLNIIGTRLEDAGALSHYGDGRVIAQSATNGRRRTSDALPLSSTHGDLVKDRHFISWLRTNLSRDINVEQAKDGVDRVWQDENGRRELQSQHVLLALSDLDIDPLNWRHDERGRAILDANVEALRIVVRRTAGAFPTKEVAVEAYRLARGLQGKNTDVAVPLYELALATGGLSVEETAEAITNYSVALLAENKQTQAISLILSNVDRWFQVPGLRPLMLNNLAVAYQGKGNVGSARVFYRRSATLGSSVARENLAELSRNR